MKKSKKCLFVFLTFLFIVHIVIGCGTKKTVTYNLSIFKDSVLTGKLITPKEFPCKIQRGSLIKGLDGEYVIELHNNELDKKLSDTSLVDAWKLDSDKLWENDVEVWAFSQNEKDKVYRSSRSKVSVSGKNRIIVHVTPDMIIDFDAWQRKDGSNSRGKHGENGQVITDYWLIYPIGTKKVDIEKQDMQIKPGVYKVGIDIPEGRYTLIAGALNPKSHQEMGKILRDIDSKHKTKIYSEAIVNKMFNYQFESNVEAYRFKEKDKEYSKIKEYCQTFRGKVPLVLDRRVISYFSFNRGLLCVGSGESTSKTSLGKDVLVDHWNYENVDIYVVDKTISGGTSGSDKYFKVTVKQVQNGKTIKTNEWTFSQFRGEWRYKTDEMKGNTSIVFNNKIFEFCMKQLGWAYEKANGYYH